MNVTVAVDDVALRTKSKSVLLAMLLAAITTTVMPPPASGDGSGKLMLVGDVLSFRESTLWQYVFEMAGGDDSSISVIGAAHERAHVYGSYAVRALERYGPFVELLPLSTIEQDFGRHYRDVVTDSRAIDEIKQSQAVFFVGGAPQRLSEILFHQNGTITPLGKAIKATFDTGGLLVSGIPASGGAHTDIDAMAVLRRGELTQEQIYQGLGLMDPAWLVDQHFFSPGRFAESLVTMHQLEKAFGIGLAPNTVAIVADGSIQVTGRAGAIVVDMSSADVDRSSGFSVSGARLSYVDRGDSIDMKTRRIKPHPNKLAGFDLIPVARLSEPGTVVEDIFKANELLNLMIATADSDEGQTLGYATDKAGDSSESVFEFRLYVGEDTRGWLSVEDSGDRHTIENIYLDMRPVARTDISISR